MCVPRIRPVPAALRRRSAREVLSGRVSLSPHRDVIKRTAERKAGRTAGLRGAAPLLLITPEEIVEIPAGATEISFGKKSLPPAE